MNNSIKLNLGLLVAVVFLAAACNREVLTIAGHSVTIETVKTAAQQQKGLGGRESLAPNAGMLFVFDQPTAQSFWMKDMKFDLDFIWINDHQVAEITPNVKAPNGESDQQLPIYTAQTAVESMLEVNAGWAEAHKIKVGDRVDGI